jgi:hypothetical protein
MKLTAIEKESALWKKIEREVTARLDGLRISNDTNLDAQATSKVRGQIAICKEVLDWAITDPEIQ